MKLTKNLVVTVKSLRTRYSIKKKSQANVRTDVSPPSPRFAYVCISVNPQRYAPTHDTSTHIFKQVNQTVRFR